MPPRTSSAVSTFCSRRRAAACAGLFSRRRAGPSTGTPERLPADEETPARPLSPYGLTKWTFESYLHIWRQVHGIVPVILRYANVYGPRQNAEGEAGVIAIFSRRLLRGKPCVIYGDGCSTRDYVYVGDVVRANQLALTLGGGGTFNIGTGQQTTIRTVFDTVRDAADRILGGSLERPRQPEYAPVRAGEVYRSALDNRRAAKSSAGRRKRLSTKALPTPWSGCIATPKCRPAFSTICRCWGSARTIRPRSPGCRA